VLETFFALEFLILLALAVISGLTGVAAIQIKYAAFRHKHLDLWKRITRTGVLAVLILFTLWIAGMLLTLLLFGWLFVIDRFAVVLPLLALPAIGVMALSLPKLQKSEAVDAKSLALTLAPVQTMPIAAFLAFYLVTVDIPAIPDARESMLYLAIVMVSAWLIWLYQTRRIKAAALRLPGFTARLLRGAGFVLVLLLAAAGWYAWSLEKSKFPETMAMVNHDLADFGGGAEFALVSMHPDSGHSHAANAGQTVSVADLTGPRSGEADKRFTLYAEKKTVTLSSGKIVEAWTFNGQSPGPPLVVHEGDLVEVKLVNKNIEQGVTVHWHGVDVPNAEDGVAGMTQDAVLPGETYSYRFVAEDTGSHWYHSHQVSSAQVKKGLFGPMIILPKEEKRAVNALDMTVFAHEWETADGTVAAVNLSDTFQGKTVRPGTEVRLRLVNSSGGTKVFSINGTPFKVAAIDGNDLHEPGVLTDKLLKIGGGGRYDVVFTMPETPVTLALVDGGSQAGIVFSKDGRGTAEVRREGDALDPTRYGTPALSPFDAVTEFDREFTMILDQMYIGNYNGRTSQLWAINGEVFPNVPTFMVQEGDIVKTTIVNRSFADHPMHLHGHHIQVLSKNGEPLSGSPLVLDTLLIEPGETYEVAFIADNPGIWMDHCHNLEHAALGMSMHLAYQNVESPFVIGGEAGNHPE
jgi:FtsP/CotA-like multicopper oxidase with cupredoxin domain